MSDNQQAERERGTSGGGMAAARRAAVVRTPPATAGRATACVVGALRVGDLLLERVSGVLRRYGLSLSMANALAILDGAGEPLPPHAITARLLVTRGATTAILDALEARGLVRRVAHPRDRRSLLIEVTPEGRRLRLEFEPALNARDEVWMGDLDVREQDTLAGLLARVQARLEQEPPGHDG